MSVNLIGYSSAEMVVYSRNPEMQETVDKVVRMMRDLGEEMDILLTLLEEDCEDQFSLTFSGTNLSLDFCPHRICLVEYDGDDEDILVLEWWERHQINHAVKRLINEANGTV